MRIAGGGRPAAVLLHPPDRVPQPAVRQQQSAAVRAGAGAVRVHRLAEAQGAGEFRRDPARLHAADHRLLREGGDGGAGQGGRPVRVHGVDGGAAGRFRPGPGGGGPPGRPPRAVGTAERRRRRAGSQGDGGPRADVPDLLRRHHRPDHGRPGARLQDGRPPPRQSGPGRSAVRPPARRRQALGTDRGRGRHGADAAGARRHPPHARHAGAVRGAGGQHRAQHVRAPRDQEGAAADAARGRPQDHPGRHPAPRRHQRLHRRRPEHGQVAVPQVRARLPPEPLRVHVRQGLVGGRPDGGRPARPGHRRVLHRGRGAHAGRQRHLLHRRVRQDGPARPGRHPRGHGAADHQHHQGGHPGDAQRPGVRPGGGEPDLRALRPDQDPEGERGPVGAHPQPLRPVLRGPGRVQPRRRPAGGRAHPQGPPVRGGGRATALHPGADAALPALRPHHPPRDHPRQPARAGGLLPEAPAGRHAGPVAGGLPHHGAAAGVPDPAERGPGAAALRPGDPAVVRPGGLPAAEDEHHSGGNVGRGRGGRGRRGRGWWWRWRWR